MVTNTTRRLILDSVYREIKEAARLENWVLLEGFAGAVRTVFRNQSQEGFASPRVPGGILRSEIASFALMFYELIWILRRKENLGRGVDAFYAREMFEIIRVVVDWKAAEADDKELPEVESFLFEVAELIERYFSRPNRDILEVKVGGMILLSLQSYSLYQIHRFKAGAGRKLLKLVFKHIPPADYVDIAVDLHRNGEVENLNWDQWRLAEIRFGGGYVFSESNYYASCAFVYWVVNKNRRWVERLETRQLEYLLRTFQDAAGTLLAEIFEIDFQEQVTQIENLIERRAADEREQILRAEVSLEQKHRFILNFQKLLKEGKLISIISALDSRAEEGIRPSRLFSLGMPKSWFLDELRDFPLENDGLVLESVERQLFAKLISDLTGLAQDLDQRDAYSLPKRSVLIITNFPGVGVDPYSEAARTMSREVGKDSEVLHFRSRSISPGLWLIDKGKLELLEGREEDSQYKIMAALGVKIEFDEDQASLIVDFNGRFNLRGGRKMFKIQIAKRGTGGQVV